MILVVDDAPESRKFLTVVLQSSGLSVACVSNGHEALTYLRSHRPPSVIILDLQMPIMDGRAFCCERETDETIKAIPVILYSSETDEHQTDLPVTVRLSKTASPKQVIDTVHRCKAELRSL